MTIAEAQRLGEQTLGQAKIESKRIDTSLLLEKVTARPRSWLSAHAEESLDAQTTRDFLELINLRRQRTPLVHLTNRREFYGLDFHIDERVLTPRIETEKMVEWAIQYAPLNSRLIDIGTGSGAIAVAIKKHRPDLEIWATDISDGALEVAKMNARKHQAEIKFVESDIWSNVEGEFATVVTNLPYLRDDADLMPEVKKEPLVALLGGEDGLDLYRRFLRGLPNHLEPNGYLFTESDPWQHEGLTRACIHVGLEAIKKSYFMLGFRQT